MGRFFTWWSSLSHVSFMRFFQPSPMPWDEGVAPQGYVSKSCSDARPPCGEVFTGGRYGRLRRGGDSIGPPSQAPAKKPLRRGQGLIGYFFFFFGYKEILRQYPPETHTTRAEAPRRATQRERL
jgi:hypothetical protein